jgi:hypothetical protein
MSKESRLKCGLSNNIPVVAYNIDGTICRRKTSMRKLVNPFYLKVQEKALRKALKSGELLKDN